MLGGELASISEIEVASEDVAEIDEIEDWSKPQLGLVGVDLLSVGGVDVGAPEDKLVGAIATPLLVRPETVDFQ